MWHSVVCCRGSLLTEHIDPDHYDDQDTQPESTRSKIPSTPRLYLSSLSHNSHNKQDVEGETVRSVPDVQHHVPPCRNLGCRSTQTGLCNGAPRTPRSDRSTGDQQGEQTLSHTSTPPRFPAMITTDPSPELGSRCRLSRTVQPPATGIATTQN